MYEIFDEFLAQQAARVLPLDLQKRQDEWLEALEVLYERIQSILQPYISSDRIVFSQYDFDMTEEYLGRYPATRATIGLVGDPISRVELNPIGTFIVGAKGRVDMVGPTMKTVKLMLVEKNRYKTGVQTPRARGNAFPPMPPEEPLDESEWVWKIATPPPHLSYLELSEVDFLEALMFVMER